MKQLAVLLASVMLCSCTVYTEKQSEALSRTVYATKDSIDLARIDLADGYINEATRIVRPPKKKIEISGIYKTPTETNTNTERVVIVPEKYKNDRVIVVGTDEYNKLLQDKSISLQLKKDNSNLLAAKAETDKELKKQAEMRDKMVRDLNAMQKSLLKKDIIILRLTIALSAVLLIFGVAIYLRIKGVL